MLTRWIRRSDGIARDANEYEYEYEYRVAEYEYEPDASRKKAVNGSRR